MIDHVTHNALSSAAATHNTGTVLRRTPFGQVRIPEAPAAQYDFGAIFGAASDQRNPVTPAAANPPATSPFPASGSLASTFAQAAVAATTTPAVAATPVAAPTVKPGIQALVTAIMNGSFHASNITDPSRLTEITPWMTDTMPNFYYASDDTAAQMAQLVGGKVVQMPAFGKNQGWIEPNANFIELPNGQTFNAADVAYYARSGVQGTAQLTADITQTINAGAAWSNYYKNGGQMPSFATGWVGAPISGMDYPPGSIGADGNVINPAMQSIAT